MALFPDRGSLSSQYLIEIRRIKALACMLGGPRDSLSHIESLILKSDVDLARVL